MRLIEAVMDANHRAIAGDATAGLHPDQFADELPLVALTCIDARLNRLLPAVLGVPEDQFIWLRNAGNILTGPLSSSMRSLSLACAIKGGREIAIIGHTDCLVGKTSTIDLLERFRALGIERHLLPDNLNEYFGTFGSERQNVIKATEIARRSPLIGPKTPVHGLLVEVETGRLEWLVNGYQALELMGSTWNQAVQAAQNKLASLEMLAESKLGEMKFPDAKIGELATKVESWITTKVHPPETPAPGPAPAPGTPPKVPLPPPIRPRIHLQRGPRNR